MKAICLIEQDEDLKEAVIAVQAKNEQFGQRMAFLKKQMDDLKIEGKKEADIFWAELEAKLRAKGMLKDYDPKKQHLHFDFNMGVLIQHDEGDCGGQGPTESGIRGLIAMLEQL